MTDKRPNNDNGSSVMVGVSIVVGAIVLMAAVIGLYILIVGGKTESPDLLVSAPTPSPSPGTADGGGTPVPAPTVPPPPLSPSTYPTPLPSASVTPTPTPARTGVAPGNYNGTYLCAQGWTDLVLEFSVPNGASQRGRVRFGGNGSIPRGSYSVAVEPQGGNRYYLRPIAWEQRPAGYVMVPARILVEGDQITGTIVDTPGCGMLRADRVR